MSTIQLTLHLLWAAFMATIGYVVEPTPLAAAYTAVGAMLNVYIACWTAERGADDEESDSRG